jgi:hypothetical protein
MTGETYTPGGDAKVISAIAKDHFGDYAAMFTHHGWPERGADMMRKVQTRVVETYGSVRAFEDRFSNKAMSEVKMAAPDCWTGQTSVFFTSFWGWTPETWGTVGWTDERGRTRRTNLLKELTDPFITVVYVTSNRSDIDPALKGMIAGFCLVSHETGSRNEFTHPIHHDQSPEKWQHSLRAVRAFSYLPEYRHRALDVFPTLTKLARHVSAMGQIISDPAVIDLLRTTPWTEVPVYASGVDAEAVRQGDATSSGMVQPGPNNPGGYHVPWTGDGMPRELYVLRLQGNTDAYLGRPADGQSIYKIGLSISPDMRRQTLQKSMPRGSFKWIVERTTRRDGHPPYSGYSAAVAGENAMKVHLARNGHHLTGEFYLCSDLVIEEAWNIGRDGALALEVTAAI